MDEWQKKKNCGKADKGKIKEKKYYLTIKIKDGGKYIRNNIPIREYVVDICWRRGNVGLKIKRKKKNKNDLKE